MHLVQSSTKKFEQKQTYLATPRKACCAWLHPSFISSVYRCAHITGEHRHDV